MDEQARGPRQGDLSWRLSSHPITLLCFLGFRICELCNASISVRLGEQELMKLQHPS